MAQSETHLDEILYKALKIESEADRAEYLNEACGSDVDLRARVERLLGAYPEAGSFLDSPAVLLNATIDQPITEKPGTQIGPYKLLQQIGEGGMGVVYMAEQKRAGQTPRRTEDHQARDGHAAGHRPLRSRTAGAGDDGPSEHRQGAGCRADRKRTALFRDGTGQRNFRHQVLRRAASDAERTSCSCSSTSARPSSTPIKRASSIATSSRPTCWSRFTMAKPSPR